MSQAHAPQRSNPARQFLAGSLAGVVASSVLTPLEVVKTRLQASGATRMRLDKILVNIMKTEGIRGLWRGVGINVLGVAPARAVHFSAYNYFKTQAGDNFGIHGTPQHLIAGAMASCTAATVTSPIWVIKTRVQLQRAPIKGQAMTAAEMAYATPLSAIRAIAKTEGFPGFFRGLTASYLGVGESAMQFALYEALRGAYLRAYHPRGGPEERASLPMGASLVLGAAAKLVASAVTYPHEVVRTRMREIPPEGSGGRPVYGSVVSTVKTVLRQEGVRGLYGGMLPHLVRTVPNAAILLLVVEAVSGRGL
ncbi:hypothetical protein FNF27_04512 [Cafeteria roenbergensis]|uniref:Mitochondrial carrier protein n=1 Tax=Cafeteria roenbergensis TaxID=33653 RepID=A0A5A8EDF0_CAFRO|nr:hypothetical protein FNF31_05261 [Cafeteria roenbergensis]KAA0159486.1 hypothetical protein FNF28_05843 [Cafeteria roenbergensis]KAA0173951.1 hypothetical protein FNF27_04512 [Cafeteria roenbergensis]